MTIVVNGRFRSRPVTGVERYAHKLLEHLDVAGRQVEVVAPARRLPPLLGHAWEQIVLPLRMRRRGPLLSLCNFGPIATKDQLVVVLDVAPFLYPEAFDPAYVAAARWIQPRLARRCRLVTISERARDDVARVLDVDPARIGIVPPAVEAPFVASDHEGTGNHCVFVGGHDARKNLGFLLRLWPRVHRELDLELVVVGRARSSTLRAAAGPLPPGVRWVTDPDDHALATLYRTARAVLSPSRYEGFGLPLLEGMACGTPFLSTDTGAAAELASDPDQQLLPLDDDRWFEQLAQWTRQEPVEIRSSGLERAATRTWSTSAAALLRLLDAARPAAPASVPR